ncbi:MAG: helix-turn-helix domain-containing protein [Clostridia bacterium]|nr:helix-turn-helix domain-containing protein [Clostridia bacterium]
MDIEKIGKFIAERRKSLNLTQAQLAQKLNITDRAVSKWETGRALPDSSIMLALCEVLSISVNDLLSGEVISSTDYRDELEKKLVEMVKQKEQHDRQLLTLECLIGVLSVLVLLLPITVGSLLPEGSVEDWQRTLIVLSGFIPAMVGIGFALKIEQLAGYYECKKCGYKYVPTFKAVNLAPHMGRTRYMKCPNCNKKSWQKKVINKDKEV